MGQDGERGFFGSCEDEEKDEELPQAGKRIMRNENTEESGALTCRRLLIAGCRGRGRAECELAGEASGTASFAGCEDAHTGESDDLAVGHGAYSCTTTLERGAQEEKKPFMASLHSKSNGSQ